MKTLEVNQIKIIETKSLLLEIIKTPSKFKDVDALITALSSQQGLAKFSDHERDISPCSLNTFKSASESLLERGFVELDELRINAKDAIEVVEVGSKTTKATKAGLRNIVDVLESELITMKKSNFLLGTIITELRGELKKMAYSNEMLDKKKSSYQELNRKIEAKLSYVLDGEV